MDYTTPMEMIDTLLKTSGGSFTIHFGRDWTLRATMSGTLLATLIHRYRHQDGRMHSAAKQEQFELNGATTYAVAGWLYATRTEFERVADLQE